jgi:hypothetical protein
METTTQVPQKIRFEVVDVKPSTETLPTMGFKEALERTTRARLLSPNKEQKVLEQTDFHPLIASAFLAFKQHYPLVLSPDMIWLTVLQGVAQHVQNHAESLRSRLVSHQTKIELVVDSRLTSFPQNDEQMLAVTRKFAEAIARHVPTDKQFLFQTEFSTTSDTDRIAQCVALMDTFQSYFDYVLYCVCGIPSVILEGAPEDWRLLRTKIECLHATDLELTWWTKHLVPLCDHFVRAAEGDIDVHHWRNLCKIIQRYGIEDLNGWLLRFIPYLKHGKNEPVIHRNPTLELTIFPDPTGDRNELSGKITGCTSDMLPRGLSRGPVTCKNHATGQMEELEFVAGLVGVAQSPHDLSLRPLTGWAICQGVAINQQIARLRQQHEVLPPTGMEPGEMIRQVFRNGLPGDVWRFYSETNGAIVTMPKSKARCRILPLAEVGPIWDPIRAFDELKTLQNQESLSMEELKERRDFYWAYGWLLKIADLGNGKMYVFGHYPEVHRGLAHHVGSWPSKAEREAQAVFVWTGERKEESFCLAAPSFVEWLTKLLDGSLIGGPPG